MSTSFKQLPVTELRSELPKFKRQVQLGLKRIAATYHTEVVGFLVPLQDLENCDFLITEDASLSDFRDHLTSFWERLQLDLDCVYVTYHSRRIMGFVSPRFSVDLPIPISDVSSKILGINSGLFSIDEKLTNSVE